MCNAGVVKGLEAELEVVISTAATGAVGFDGGVFSLGVAVTVMVLCTTSVTVTYETPHAAPSLPGPTPDAADPEPVPSTPVSEG